MILVVVSLIYTSKKHLFFNLLVILFPLVFFYVFISMRIKMSFIRYCLSVMGLLFVPLGAGMARVLTLKKKWIPEGFYHLDWQALFYPGSIVSHWTWH